MSEGKRHKYNRIIGIKGDDVYVLDEVFEYPDGFHGATGFSMRLIMPDEINDLRGDDSYYDYYKEGWKEAVRTDATEDSLEEWSERAWEEEKQDYNAVFPGDWDHSFVDEFKKGLDYLEQQRPEDFRRFWDWWMDRLENVDCEDPAATYQEEWTNDNDSCGWQELGVFRVGCCGRCLTELGETDLVLDPEALRIVQEAEKQDANN